MRTFPWPQFLAVTALFLLAATVGKADTVKTKDGKTYEGKITLEASDFIKIEVSRSASIKETKMISRADITSLVKSAPDDVEFAKIRKLVPTAPLMSASSYRTALETGPDMFLKSFAGSRHKPEVEKIQKTLKEELDKVERGNIKVDDTWYSPQDQIDYKGLIDSKIRLYRMQNMVKSGTYNGFIGALREYETIEENYKGTPAFPAALTEAKTIMPSLGNQLTRMLRDVEYRNAEWEKNKSQLDDVARQQVEAARAAEEATYKTNLAADKKAGIKWVRLNPRSKPSIEGYIKLLKSEIPKLNIYDVGKLEAQANELIKVDEMVATGNLDIAKTKLADASAMPIFAASGDSKKKSSSKKGSKGYTSEIRAKLDKKIKERAAAMKAAEEAEASEALAADLKETSGDKKDEASDEETAEEGDSEKTDEPQSADAAFAALAQAEAKKEDPKKKSSKKKSSSSKKDDDDDDKDDDRDYEEPDTGGVINFQFIVIGLTVLLLIAIVVLKVLGIGGKKEDDAGGE